MTLTFTPVEGESAPIDATGAKEKKLTFAERKPLTFTPQKKYDSTPEVMARSFASGTLGVLEGAGQEIGHQITGAAQYQVPNPNMPNEVPGNFTSDALKEFEQRNPEQMAQDAEVAQKAFHENTRGVVQNLVEPANPDPKVKGLKKFATQDLPQGLGSAATFLVNTPAATALMFASGADESRQDAAKHGADEATQDAAAGAGGVIETATETLGIESIKRAANALPGWQGKLASIGVATATNAIQEPAAGLLKDLVAKYDLAYDPERDLWAQRGQEAAVGGGVGLVLSALMTLAGGRRAKVGTNDKGEDIFDGHTDEVTGEFIPGEGEVRKALEVLKKEGVVVEGEVDAPQQLTFTEAGKGGENGGDLAGSNAVPATIAPHENLNVVTDTSRPNTPHINDVKPILLSPPTQTTPAPPSPDFILLEAEAAEMKRQRDLADIESGNAPIVDVLPGLSEKESLVYERLSDKVANGEELSAGMLEVFGKLEEKVLGSAGDVVLTRKATKEEDAALTQDFEGGIEPLQAPRVKVTRSLPRQRVEQKVREFEAEVPGAPPHVLFTEKGELPENLQQYADEPAIHMPEHTNADGVVVPAITYINAGLVQSEEGLYRTLLHEDVTHYGLRALLREKGDTPEMLEGRVQNLMNDIYNDAGFRKELADWNAEYYSHDTTTPEGRARATEEFIAKRGEKGSFTKATKRVWNKLISILMAAVRKIPYLKNTRFAQKFRKSDVESLLRKSFDNLRSGKASANVVGGVESTPLAQRLKSHNLVSKVLGQLAETLPSVGRESGLFTESQLREFINKEGVSVEEKSLLTYTLNLPQFKRESKIDFAEFTQTVQERFIRLVPTNVFTYADFGLSQIGRARGAYDATTTLYAPAEPATYEREGADVTQLHPLKYMLQDSGHFGDQAVMFHTRTFKGIPQADDWGTRYVIEIQASALRASEYRNGMEGYIEQLGNDTPESRIASDIFATGKHYVIRAVQEEYRRAYLDGDKKIRFPTGLTVASVESWIPQSGLSNALNIVKGDLPEERKAQEFNSGEFFHSLVHYVDPTKYKQINALLKVKRKAVKDLEESGRHPDQLIDLRKDLTALQAHSNMIKANRATVKREIEVMEASGKEGYEAHRDLLLRLEEKAPQIFVYPTMRPLFRGYEETLPKQLRSLYGEDGVKRVTDKHGFDWWEVEVTANKARAIRPFLQKEIEGTVEPLRQVGMSEREVAAQSYQLDRFNTYYKYLGNLMHMTNANEHIPGVLEYWVATNQMTTYAREWAGRADRTLQEIRKLPQEQVDGLFRFMMDQTFTFRKHGKWSIPIPNLSEELVPDEAVTARTISHYGLDENTLKVYQQIASDYQAVIEELGVLGAEQLRESHDGEELEKALAELQANIKGYQRQPYAPAIRFGKYTYRAAYRADVLNAKGGVVHKQGETAEYGAYDSKNLREERIKELKKEGYQITSSVDTSVEAQNLGMLNRDFLVMMKDHLELSAEQLKNLQELIDENNPTQGMSKFLRRKAGVAGWSQDGPRAYATYMQTIAYALGKLKYRSTLVRAKGQMHDSLRNLYAPDGEKLGEVKGGEFDIDTSNRAEVASWYDRHYQYIMSNQAESSIASAAAFISYIWAAPKAVAVNFSQLPLQTFPYLGARYGFGKTTAAMLKAVRNLKGVIYRPEQDSRDDVFRAAHAAAHRAGVFNETLMRELSNASNGYDVARTKVHSGLSRGMQEVLWWGGAPFQFSEKINRYITFVSAFELEYKRLENEGRIDDRGVVTSIPSDEHFRLIDTLNKMPQGMLMEAEWEKHPAYVAARRAVENTQFIFARHIRPRIMQNAIGRFAGVFQTPFLGIMHNIWGGDKRAWLAMLVALGILTGYEGLPFSTTAMKVFDVAATKVLEKSGSTKYQLPVNVKEELRRDIEKITGAGDLLATGLLGPHGILNLSSSISMGDPFNIGESMRKTVLLTPDRDDPEVLTTVLGNFVVPDMVNSYVQSVGEGSVLEKVPGIKHPYKFYKRVEEGGVYTRGGLQIIKFGDGVGEVNPYGTQWLLSALGFPPDDLSVGFETFKRESDGATYWVARRSDLRDKAIRARDVEAEATVNKAIRIFNKQLPSGAGALRLPVAAAIKASTIRKQVKHDVGVSIPPYSRDRFK